MIKERRKKRRKEKNEGHQETNTDMKGGEIETVSGQEKNTSNQSSLRIISFKDSYIFNTLKRLLSTTLGHCHSLPEIEEVVGCVAGKRVEDLIHKLSMPNEDRIAEAKL